MITAKFKIQSKNNNQEHKQKEPTKGKVQKDQSENN